jgi:hypothetical protein
MARGDASCRGLPLGPAHEEREAVELAVDDEVDGETTGAAESTYRRQTRRSVGRQLTVGARGE